jgi:hypothetical protein
MVQRVATVAFEGIEARAGDVQVQVAPGLPLSMTKHGSLRELQMRQVIVAAPLLAASLWRLYAVKHL